MNSFNLKIYYGFKAISYLGPKTGDILPVSTKEANSLNSFKKLIEKWVPQTCPVDYGETTYLALVLLKTCYSKHILLLSILMISYTGPYLLKVAGHGFL